MLATVLGEDVTFQYIKSGLAEEAEESRSMASKANPAKCEAHMRQTAMQKECLASLLRKAWDPTQYKTHS